MTLHNHLSVARAAHEEASLQRQIAATDRQIDQLVHELYGLNEEEIKIVKWWCRTTCTPKSTLALIEKPVMDYAFDRRGME